MNVLMEVEADYGAEMSWSVPLYSKSRVNAAGRTLIDPDASAPERELAIAIANNWRSSHSFPLNTFQVTLRKRARTVDGDALVAQRIKRMPSIISKLEKRPRMGLARMQDLGGCRAVLKSVEDVHTLADAYTSWKSNHRMHKLDDYFRNPKASGYRGIHLVYRYRSDRKETYNGLSVEIQLRTRRQHAWATAVETVGTFVRQALKSSQGQDEWLRFFALMSSVLGHAEGLPPVPGTPAAPTALRDELRSLASQLDVLSRLDAYGSALRVLGAADEVPQTTRLFLLSLDSGNRTLDMRPYRAGELLRASEEYEALERAAANDPLVDVVLVSADSLAALERAYPNYFLDTTEFRKWVEEAIGG